MDPSYLITPLLAWLTAGSLKFLINSLKAGEPAIKQVGYGGLPSNHSSIVSSMAVLIALRDGIDTAAFGVAVTLAFIVIMDANSLRRQVGRQAEAINRLSGATDGAGKLRERMGHSRVEILAGIVVGSAVAWAVYAAGGLAS